MRILKRFLERPAPGDSERTLVTGSGISFVGVVLIQVFGLLLLLLKTHLLTADEVGLLALAGSITITIFVVIYGFPETMLRHAALFRGEGSPAKVKSTAVAVYRMAVPVMLALLAITIVFAEGIAGIFRVEGLTVLIRILAVGMFCNGITLLNVSLLQSRFLVIYAYIVQNVQLLLCIGLVLAFLFTSNRLLLFVIAQAAASVIVLGYSCLVVRREFGFVFSREAPSEPHQAPLLRFAVFSSLTASLNRFRDEIVILLTGFFLAESDVALYLVALKAGLVSKIPLTAVASIFGPMAGHFYGRRDIRSIKRLHLKSALVLLACSGAVFIIYVFFGRFILGLFGTYFRQAYAALLLVAFANLINAGTGTVTVIITMMGRPQINTANGIVLLVAMIVLCYHLIPAHGVIGAAAAYAASTIFVNLLRLAEVLVLYRIESSR